MWTRLLKWIRTSSGGENAEFQTHAGLTQSIELTRLKCPGSMEDLKLEDLNIESV